MALEFNTQLNSILKKTGEAIGQLVTAVDNITSFMQTTQDIVVQERHTGTSVDSYNSTTLWGGFRVWSSGRREAWGHISLTGSNGTPVSDDITLPFTDTDEYAVILTPSMCEPSIIDYYGILRKDYGYFSIEACSTGANDNLEFDVYVATAAMPDNSSTATD